MSARAGGRDPPPRSPADPPSDDGAPSDRSARSEDGVPGVTAAAEAPPAADTVAGPEPRLSAGFVLRVFGHGAGARIQVLDLRAGSTHGFGSWSEALAYMRERAAGGLG